MALVAVQVLEKSLGCVEFQPFRRKSLYPSNFQLFSIQLFRFADDLGETQGILQTPNFRDLEGRGTRTVQSLGP